MEKPYPGRRLRDGPVFRQRSEGADEAARGFSRAAFSNQKNNRDNAVPSPLPPAKFVQTIWDQLLTRKIFRDKELAMKITLARPLLPTLAGIGAGNSSHFSANYCEAPSLSKSKQASGLEDPRSGADARSVRGRAGILSRGLGVNVCEGGHRRFVRFCLAPRPFDLAPGRLPRTQRNFRVPPGAESRRIRHLRMRVIEILRQQFWTLWFGPELYRRERCYRQEEATKVTRKKAFRDSPPV